MSGSEIQGDILSELGQRAIIDAQQFFHPPVAVDKLKVTKKEVNGGFAFITVESSGGRRVILRYAIRTKQLVGTI